MSHETLPLDFVQYLALSLAVDGDAAFAKLVDWIANYEPSADSGLPCCSATLSSAFQSSLTTKSRDSSEGTPRTTSSSHA
jgi:hypothetical protein